MFNIVTDCLEVVVVIVSGTGLTSTNDIIHCYCTVVAPPLLWSCHTGERGYDSGGDKSVGTADPERGVIVDTERLR